MLDMEMDNGDQPISICHIQSIHMYPLQNMDLHKQLPFGLLTGETVVHSGNSVDGLIVITNYRLYLQNGVHQYHIPLGLIESVENRDLFYLQIFCKDARTYKCTFENNESALEWYDRITKASDPPRQIEQIFSFYYCVWSKEKGGEDMIQRIDNQKYYSFDRRMFENEMARLQFQGDSWRITKANENYKLCPTYPPFLLVPSCINDEMLESVAKFRSSRRIPAAVWRHTRNGAVIARCSQPEVGWLGWRSGEDEDLIKAISEACNFDRSLRAHQSDNGSVISQSPGSLHSDESLQITGEISHQEKKVLIMDARSYTTAVANRARGGGCECPEYYPNCEIQFMNLPNIHSIRKSFHALRQLCMSSAEQQNWLTLLEGTRWLQHMSGLLKASVTLTNAVERDARPALVHCSDGWDRTPQIVALAELLLDPYYRTVDGFRVLIEREWLAFGHKFADRCGHSGGSDDQNERCPVFLQFLDCVHQLLVQFPVSFEFSQNYLIKLAQHTYSNLFGTFLCNSQKQREKTIIGRTFSVWEFLESPCFRNYLFAPPSNSSSAGRVLWPKTNVRDLRLWSEVYLGSMETNFSPEEVSGSACPGPPELGNHQNMAKTRSYGDLRNAEPCMNTVYGGRRSSDPNIPRELKLLQQDPITIPVTPNKTLHSITCNGSDIMPLNGDTGPDFLPSDLEDNPIECNQDCMFNEDNRRTQNQTLTDDQIDGLDFEDSDCEKRTVKDPAIQMSEITNHISEMTQRLTEIPLSEPANFINCQNGEFDCNISNGVAQCENGEEKDDVVESIFLQTKKSESSENGDADDDDSDVVTTKSERGSKTDRDAELDSFFENNRNFLNGNASEKSDRYPLVNLSNGGTDGAVKENGLAICRNGDIGRMLDLERSVETSTETLVSEHVICGSSPKEYNGFEKIRNPVDIVDGTDSCKICSDNIKVPNGNCSTSDECKYPHPVNGSPNGGWDGTTILHNYTHFRHKNHPYHCTLGDDGLMPVRSPIQERLDQILEEQKRKVELLEKELHASRQILIKQACHKCHANDNERLDDNSNIDSECRSSCTSSASSSSSWKGGSSSSKRGSLQLLRLDLCTNSVVESVNSASEGQASAGESLRSDMSWVAVEDNLVAECQGTLWVPDHAASKCTGCGTEFWLGRRRHHCRKCGRIFCADCSENSTPLPAEQLYNPVRVCTDCFKELRRDHGTGQLGAIEITGQCKHGAGCPSSSPHQNGRCHPIAASSN